MTEQELNNERERLAITFRSNREYRQISLNEISERTGMAVITIERFESGKMWLNVGQFVKLLDAIGMDIGIREKI